MYSFTIEKSEEVRLVHLAQGGDRNALDALLRENYGRIYSICRKLAGNDADADDATQEALLSIVRKISTFKGESRFSTWAYRVATNSCLDEMRKRKRRPRLGLLENDEALYSAEKSSRSIEDQVADRLLIEEALRLLPDEFRIPLVLRDQVGMNYQEIGDHLSLPEGTVKSRIARARTRLKVDDSGNQKVNQNVKGLEHE
ncbi:MAG: RNA polymerase subunit sigma-24 [Acidimicrobiaceae bacterium]|nr:RNA polymerase subunit sigma-24 [Acidimicrobiaceae bacterium]